MSDATETIEVLHTLGPAGTNCEAAAYKWLERLNGKGEVFLHPTLEEAVEKMSYDDREALLACAVYPDLHMLVFNNLKRLRFVDSFVMPTHNMVLAARDSARPRSVSTHPAPQTLVPDWVDERRFVDSNSQAARDCVAGITEGCITTIVAARDLELRVIEDFGPVPMVFTIHAPCA